MIRLGICLAAAVALVIGSSALAADSGTPPAEEAPIPPVVWELAEIDIDGTPTTPDNPSDYTIQYLPDGRFHVRADCNQGNGQYTAEPPQIELREIATTKVACPEGSLFDEYISQLESATSFQLEQETLILELSDGRQMVFTPTLTGVVWQWERFMTQRGGMTPEDPAAYTLEFLPDGTILVVADCNQGSGQYTVQEPHQIELSDIAMTEIGCPEGSLSDRFVELLPDVRAYLFNGGKLYLELMADGGALIFNAHVAPEDEATPVAGN